MDEKLIAGYTAYTTADEYSAAATGDAPGTTPSFLTVVISPPLGVITVRDHC
ncbi:LxmA leader domain family RiPP [Streptomyces sp. NPDC048506]|uniref:LxmA leader domain family RiPP n=1 Tax=Streptomyces sp. NPDC048506 TaxID=3155028 RepID=UPI00342FF973